MLWPGLSLCLYGRFSVYLLSDKSEFTRARFALFSCPDQFDFNGQTTPTISDAVAGAFRVILELQREVVADSFNVKIDDGFGENAENWFSKPLLTSIQLYSTITKEGKNGVRLGHDLIFNIQILRNDMVVAYSTYQVDSLATDFIDIEEYIPGGMATFWKNSIGDILAIAIERPERPDA